MRRFKRKKGPVQSKKIKVDGIQFASGLEAYMYKALKKAKIKADYEKRTFEIFRGFYFPEDSYERQANGKGDMVVVLTNLAELSKLRIEDCIDSAYDEISSRKGKMINGTFVKEDNLSVAEKTLLLDGHEN